MGRLIRFLFKIFFFVLLVIALTVVWICVDGLEDVGGKTDVALAMADPAKPEPVLDRAAKLYSEGAFPYVIVTASTGQVEARQLGSMRAYLEREGVPESAINVEGNSGGSIAAIAHNTAETMKDRDFKTVTLIQDYTTMTRMKLALYHENIEHTHKSHVGELTKQDSMALATEVYAIYDYIGRTWVVPGMSELKKEAGVAADKASQDAKVAKKKAEHSLDNLSK